MEKEIENVITYDNENGGVYACNFKGEPVSKWEDRGNCAFTYSFTVMRLKRVLGQVLTVIDASVHDKIQNKAMKDLVRNIYSDEMNFSADMAYDQNVLKKQAEEYFENVSDEELDKSQVTIEEALGVE